ncbi:MAG TPA: hypothetical protein VG778_11615 [Blastocatellia bacterium]|nr:hypothetical protein [Blastocatellia bacterium]
MIIGAHSIIYSTNPDADRAFLRDVLKLPNVDVGEGWLIFGLPPSEVAVHPSGENDVHEFYLMCDDVQTFAAEMEKHSISCTVAQDLGWGVLTQVVLPGGGRLGVYQPRHARPMSMSDGKEGLKRAVKKAVVRKAAKTAVRKAALKKAASKKVAKASSKKTTGTAAKKKARRVR